MLELKMNGHKTEAQLKHIQSEQLKGKLDTGERSQTIKLVGQEVGRSELMRRGEG